MSSKIRLGRIVEKAHDNSKKVEDMYSNSANLIFELLSAWPRSKICFLTSVSMWAAPCFKPGLDKTLSTQIR